LETRVRDCCLDHFDRDVTVGELWLADIHTRLDAAWNVRDLNPIRARANMLASCGCPWLYAQVICVYSH
jgi:hypothetical protein